MGMIFVWAFFIVIGIVFIAALVYYITYPKYEKHVDIEIELPSNSEFEIKKTDQNFDINIDNNSTQ